MKNNDDKKYIYILNQKTFEKFLKQKKIEFTSNYQFQKKLRLNRRNSLTTKYNNLRKKYLIKTSKINIQQTKQ